MQNCSGGNCCIKYDTTNPITEMFLISSCNCLCPTIEVRCQVENEDVDEAALTGDAPTTSE